MPLVGGKSSEFSGDFVQILYPQNFTKVAIYMDILQMTTHLSYRKNTLFSMVAYK